MVSLVKFLGLRDNFLIDSFALVDMPKLYAASLVCVYSSRVSEPFGLTMLEALSAGKPIVVTETGECQRLLDTALMGLLFR